MINRILDGVGSIDRRQWGACAFAFALGWSGIAHAVTAPAACPFVSQGPPNGTAGNYLVSVTNPNLGATWNDSHVYIEFWDNLIRLPGDVDERLVYAINATTLLDSPNFWTRIQEYFVPQGPSQQQFTGSLINFFDRGGY